MLVSDWTSTRTISPPEDITIDYGFELSNGETEKRSVTFTSIPTTESRTEYRTYTFRNGEGKLQRADVATRKSEEKRVSVAAVAGSYISAKLSLGLDLPSGSAITRSDTTYQYKITTDGPQLISEETITKISDIQFVSGLPIPKEAFTTFSASTALMTAQITRIQYNTVTTVDGRSMTRQTTSRSLSFGLSQEGQAAFAILMNSLKEGGEVTGADVAAAVSSVRGLRSEGTEVQVSIGRAPTPQKPSDQDISASIIIDESEGLDRFITGTIRFQGENYIDPEESVTAVYDMPFAPDDYFLLTGSTSTGLVRNGARAAAEKFGELEAAMDIGHAFGYNIVTEWSVMPTPDLAPIYVRIAGIEAAFLTDSVTYAWDANGIVVSSDLMLVGVTGWYGSSQPSTSWVRLPVPTLGLNKID
jgi:hypothetical protein